VTRLYSGRTSEQRMAERRAALMDAALSLLAENGVEAVTMRAVRARAGLNDRYFYEHFTDRDALLVAILDDTAASGTARILGAIAAAKGDVSDIVAAAMRTGLDYLTEDPRRGHVLIQSQATEALRSRRQEINRSLAEIMVQQGRRILHQPMGVDSNADLAALTLAGGMLDLLTMWLRGDLDLGKNRLADFLSQMLLANVDFGARTTAP
jgi:AcrR family transcriptional regulator